MTGDIVHLIGFPGVGKLTIAREIVKQRLDFVLVDNHLINNPVFRVMNADGKTPLPPEIWSRTSQIRAIVLDTMANLSPPHLSFVMTNVAVKSENDEAECHKIEATAGLRGGRYFPVILTCDIEENRRRIVSPERGLNLKLTDPGAPDRWLGEKPLLRFDGHPNRIQIDVTYMTPAEAGQEILEEVECNQTSCPASR